MEVVNLVFAILGHVLASVIYVARRIKFSSATAPPPAPRVVVDRSSILERKEEIKELWEKKMMSSEHLVTIESNKEEEELKSVQNGEVPNGDAHKMSNGDIPKEDESDDSHAKVKESCEKMNGDARPCESLAEDQSEENKLSNINAVEEEEEGEVTDTSDNKCPETETILKAERVEELHAQQQETEIQEVEIKEEIFTSTFQQTLVITKKQETNEVEEVFETKETNVALEDTQEDFEEIEARIEAEESAKEKELLQEADNLDEPEALDSKEDLSNDVEILKEELNSKVPESPKEREFEENHFDMPEGIDSPDSLETIEIPDGSDDFEHYTVLDSRSNESEVVMNGVVKNETYYSSSQEESHTICSNETTTEVVHSQHEEVQEKTFDEQFVLDTREVISPTGDEDKKDSSNKKSRIHTLGVQKTEQPYSTCTTETKIAMEIREMREREEELKKMRERQVQVSPVPPPQKAPAPAKAITVQKPPPQPTTYSMPNNQKLNSTPGYRVSSVFGPRGVSQQVKDENKFNRNFNKESPVEKEIRIAKDREEELRRQKGLPPREDDSYVKPSQVKSSQAKAFGKMINSENSRLIATAKIQHEIEEQTLREMALRESGHIQTLSCERTDSKVTKLKTLEVGSPECTSPTFQNGVGSVYSNGMFSNGHTSPDYTSSKRSTPSPTGTNYLPQYTAPRNLLSPVGNKSVSMQKFIASRGKETAFAPPRNGAFHAKTDYQDTSRAIPDPGKLKRTVSVESKIQQEILEMKRREEELKLLHTGRTINSTTNGNDYDAPSKTPEDYYQNGEADETEETCPRRSNLIAQWEQRIQKSEGKA